MPLAKGPFFKFNNISTDFTDIFVEWGSADPTNKGHFFMDLSNNGAMLDDAFYGNEVPGEAHNSGVSGAPMGTYRYRIENVDASTGAVVEETSPAGAAFDTLPFIPMPPDPATTIVTLSGACASPYGDILGRWRKRFTKFPEFERGPIFPYPYLTQTALLPEPTTVVAANKNATLRITAMSGATPVANIPVTFTIAWGYGTLGPSVTPGTSVQVSTGADGKATATFCGLNAGQIAVITANSLYDTASATSPIVFYIFVR